MNFQPKMFYGNYRGVVLRNDDPLKAGRVKLRVFGVYDDLPEDQIPWAIYADPMMGGLAEVGSIIVPEVESHIWCFFEGGNHHYPVFWAGAPALKNGKVPDLPSESRSGSSAYPHNKVFKTAGGILFELDDSQGNARIRIHHPSGNDMLTDNGGNVTETIVGNETSSVGGTRSSTVTGADTTTVDSDQTNSISGNKTDDVGGTAATSATEVTIDGSGNVSITAGGQVIISGALVSIN